MPHSPRSEGQVPPAGCPSRCGASPRKVGRSRAGCWDAARPLFSLLRVQRPIGPTCVTFPARLLLFFASRSLEPHRRSEEVPRRRSPGRSPGASPRRCTRGPPPRPSRVQGSTEIARLLQYTSGPRQGLAQEKKASSERTGSAACLSPGEKAAQNEASTVPRRHHPLNVVRALVRRSMYDTMSWPATSARAICLRGVLSCVGADTRCESARADRALRSSGAVRES